MRVYVDDEPLDFDTADIREYERVLDMRRGVSSANPYACSA
jgi:alpha,alpha-trehalose phosphorylase